MSDRMTECTWVPKFARFVMVCSLVFIGLGLIATVANGVYCVYLTTAGTMFHWTILVPWVLAVLGEVALGLWVIVAYGVVTAMVSSERAANHSAGYLAGIETLMGAQVESTRRLTEHAVLSDRAKSLIFRERELETRRSTIHHELMKQDYQAALTLIDSIEGALGYTDEAARLREEVEASRKATLDEKIDAAVTRIQQIVDRHDWVQAMRESRRVIALFPDHPKVASLPDRIHAARSRHKSELLKRYGEAVKKNDIDLGIDLLTELDLYLTPQEAAALAESARGVFKAKLHNLGVQFAISVTEQRWDDAIAAGEAIVREFPNSRMAHEVRERLDALRVRSQQPKGPAAG